MHPDDELGRALWTHLYRARPRRTSMVLHHTTGLKSPPEGWCIISLGGQPGGA
jgi:hypothetical protein